MTPNRHRVSPRGRRAAAAIEFALIAPVLAILTMGTFDYCWYFVQWQTVIISAQVGARAGSQTKMEEKPDVVASEVAADALLANFMGTVPDGATVQGSIVNSVMVQVDVRVPFTPLVGYVAIPETIAVTTRMLIEDTR